MAAWVRPEASTASATLLAPSVTFTENIWRQFRPHASDQQQLRTMRITTLVFSGLVLAYAIRMEGTSIYELVSGAYQVPLVGAFFIDILNAVIIKLFLALPWLA